MKEIISWVYVRDTQLEWIHWLNIFYIDNIFWKLKWNCIKTLLVQILGVNG